MAEGEIGGDFGGGLGLGGLPEGAAPAGAASGAAAGFSGDVSSGGGSQDAMPSGPGLDFGGTGAAPAAATSGLDLGSLIASALGISPAAASGAPGGILGGLGVDMDTLAAAFQAQSPGTATYGGQYAGGVPGASYDFGPIGGPAFAGTSIGAGPAGAQASGINIADSGVNPNTVGGLLSASPTGPSPDDGSAAGVPVETFGGRGGYAGLPGGTTNAINAALGALALNEPATTASMVANAGGKGDFLGSTQVADIGGPAYGSTGGYAGLTAPAGTQFAGIGGPAYGSSGGYAGLPSGLTAAPAGPQIASAPTATGTAPTDQNAQTAIQTAVLGPSTGFTPTSAFTGGPSVGQAAASGGGLASQFGASPSGISPGITPGITSSLAGLSSPAPDPLTQFLRQFSQYGMA